MFATVYAAEGSAPNAVIEVAREFSPRVEVLDAAREVVIDVAGLTRLFGDMRTLAGELRRTAADRRLQVRVAVAPARTAARLIVRHRAGITIVDAGDVAGVLAPLPIELLAHVHEADGSDDPAELIRTLRRWGLRTLGDLSALPADDVAARLGQSGAQWQRVARGDDRRPLVPSVPEERFEEALDLEWPIEGLEPLAFVLGRLLEPLSLHLERRDRGAAVVYIRLHLVTRTVHERALQLPVAMRDARTLRTLLLLDLESHPPPAAIDRVVVAVDPTPGRVIQYSLLTRPLPTPEQVSTLMARLGALMGEMRCGAPASVDAWEPGAFAMVPFAPAEHPADRSADPDLRVPRGDRPGPAIALRRFRAPVIARVREVDGRPVRVAAEGVGVAGGHVESCAGPWRTSGAWWLEAGDAARRSHDERRHGDAGRWDRDEWDVTLTAGDTYRIFRERNTARWFIEGIVD